MRKKLIYCVFVHGKYISIEGYRYQLFAKLKKYIFEKLFIYLTST